MQRMHHFSGGMVVALAGTERVMDGTDGPGSGIKFDSV